MSNNFDITVHDFENICRTCLSRENLNPLYEKCSGLTCPAEMLMACTFVKFTEEDGLPVKICTNCIHEINQAFSFAKRCETTDTILRKCVNVIKTEFLSQKVEPIIKAEEEIVLPNKHRIVDEVLGDCEYVEVKIEYVEEIKQEEESKVEYKEFKQELLIEKEYDENYNHPADESYEDNPENRNKTYSEKSDNSGSRSVHRSTNTQLEEGSSRDEDVSTKRLYLLKDDQSSKNKGVQSYPCYVCGKAFSQLGKLKNHELIHTGEKSHICCFCNKAFADSTNLKRHIRIHTGEKPYTCYTCNKAFIQHIDLKKHIRIHTGEKPYICGVCSKNFPRAHHLTSHMRLHTGEKPYICEVCSKTFAHSGTLKMHMRLHTGEKPHICKLCNKAFTQPNQLKSHMSLHTGEKLHTCGVCHKAFTHSNTLKNHIRLHTGENMYTCEVCSKAFNNSGTLKTHMTIHTGEKSHICEVCNKAFAQLSTLKNHMSLHTGEKPHACGVCSKAFSRPGSLKRHMKIHTGAMSVKFATRVASGKDVNSS